MRARRTNVLNLYIDMSRFVADGESAGGAQECVGTPEGADEAARR